MRTRKQSSERFSRWAGSRAIREQPWRISIAAVAGLLVASIIAGLMGLLLNRSVERVTDQALRYDIELEDEADDLRAAVLDIRHYHRNIDFGGPSRPRIEDFENAYVQLEEEIREFEEIGVGDPGAPQPEEIRRMAEEYYAGFRPAIDNYGGGDAEAFVEASDRGLERIGEMEVIGEGLDELGERRSETALRGWTGPRRRARVVLFAVIFGLLLVGAGLAYAVVRVVGELRRLYAEQQAASEAGRGHASQNRLHRRCLARAEDAPDSATRQRAGGPGAGHRPRPHGDLRRDCRGV